MNRYREISDVFYSLYGSIGTLANNMQAVDGKIGFNNARQIFAVRYPDERLQIKVYSGDSVQKVFTFNENDGTLSYSHTTDGNSFTTDLVVFDNQPKKWTTITVLEGLSVDYIKCHTVGKLCIVIARLSTGDTAVGSTDYIIRGLPVPLEMVKFPIQLTSGSATYKNVPGLVNTYNGAGAVRNDWGSIPANTGFFVNITYAIA